MDQLGDYGTDPNACPPDHGLGVDGKPGQCPQSFGILQVRYPYHGPPVNQPTWPEAVSSTAYNADYTYAYWRGCYEGDFTWLNDVEHGSPYVAGDLWGCLGVWYSGRWHTPTAEGYIQAVKGYYSDQVWTRSSFVRAG
jgi:autotransporter family porin